MINLRWGLLNNKKKNEKKKKTICILLTRVLFTLIVVLHLIAKGAMVSIKSRFPSFNKKPPSR